jgi:uncharacterized membrane protein
MRHECTLRQSSLTHNNRIRDMSDSTHPTDNSSSLPAKQLPITRMFAKVCYGLFIAGCFLPPLLLVAIVLNLLRSGRARGTWLESHFRRQLNSFVLALVLLGIVALAFISLSGAPYLLGSLVGAGALSSESAIAFALLPLAAALLPVIFFLARMASGLSALNRDQTV